MQNQSAVDEFPNEVHSAGNNNFNVNNNNHPTMETINSMPAPPQEQPIQDRIISILENQATVMAFLFWLCFSLVATGAIDWTGSYCCWALAVRLVLHAAVILYQFPYSDIVLSALGCLTIGLGFPLVDSTAGAGVWSYVLLILPFYTEEAILNVTKGTSNASAGSPTYRKRAVQFISFFAPIATAIFFFFQIHGGILFHVISLLVIIVYALSYILRALEDPSSSSSSSSSSNSNDNNKSNENQESENDQQQQQQQQQPPQEQSSIGSGVSNIMNSIQTINDPVSGVISQIRERKTHWEAELARDRPQIYTYYLHINKPYTTAVCAVLIFVLLVINVATFPVDHYVNNNGAPTTNNASTTTTLAPSSRFAVVASPPTTSVPATTKNDGGGANPNRPFLNQIPVYNEHYYKSVGLLGAFLLLALEMCYEVFVPKDHKLNLIPRYKRFGLLAFAIVISFLPSAWKISPVAMAVAAIVPWLSWRESCEMEIKKKREKEQGGEEDGSQNNNNKNNNNNNNSAVQSNSQQQQQNIFSIDTASSSANQQQQRQQSGENEGEQQNQQQQQQQQEEGQPPATTANERIILDFGLPVVVTALLVLLSLSDEAKQANHFLTFVLICTHSAMSFFLWTSLKQETNLLATGAPQQQQQ